MSLYPSSLDVFVDRTGSDVISSSDPNNCFDAIEKIENFLGASGAAQSKNVTLVNMFRSMLNPILECSYKGVDTIEVEAGVIALFSTTGVVFKRNAVATTCNLSVDLLNGSEAGSTWYDLYAIGDGANTQFTLGFLGEGTNPSAYATYYAKINSFRNDGAGNITKFYQHGNFMQWDLPFKVLSQGTSAGAWSAALSCSVCLPAIGTLAEFNLVYGFNGESAQGSAYIRPNGATWAASQGYGIDTSQSYANMNCCMATDKDRQIQYYTVASGAGGDNFTITIWGYYLNL